MGRSDVVRGGDFDVGKRRYGRFSVETSNEDKVFFRQAGLTKKDLVDYYERVADRMIPHLKDRPSVLQRFPDGVHRDGFFQKQAGDYFPDWMTTVRVAVKATGGHQDLVVCDKKATLVYLADQACVTFHRWLSRCDAIENPDLLVIDLDPPRNGFAAARTAALRVRELLDELGLACFVGLSGSQGLHVTAPLDGRQDFGEVRNFARDSMDLLASRYPDELTTEQRKQKRRGRVYLDCGRNAYAQTAVAPWSVRALPEAPVAAPISWNDVEKGRLGPRDFTVRNIFRRIARRTDPWKGMRRRASSVESARERLLRLRRRAGVS
jgi:bifunctional non-homologous end joining protein LigD